MLSVGNESDRQYLGLDKDSDRLPLNDARRFGFILNCLSPLFFGDPPFSPSVSVARLSLEGGGLEPLVLVSISPPIDPRTYYPSPMGARCEA